MVLSAAEIARITAYLDATTPLPDYADIIFVFGSRLLKPAELAAQLYNQNRAPYIVLTGGANRATGENEAKQHYDFLTASGISAEKIIVEDRSTNTLENVTFAIPLIEQKLGMHSLHSVLAVCKWMHSRRALMTLKCHFPKGIRYYASTYDPKGITRENWYLDPRSEAADVLKNWERIPQYVDWQHIEEIVRVGNYYI